MSDEASGLRYGEPPRIAIRKLPGTNVDAILASACVRMENIEPRGRPK